MLFAFSILHLISNDFMLTQNFYLASACARIGFPFNLRPALNTNMLVPVLLIHGHAA